MENNHNENGNSSIKTAKQLLQEQFNHDSIEGKIVLSMINSNLYEKYHGEKMERTYPIFSIDDVMNSLGTENNSFFKKKFDCKFYHS